MIKKETLVEKMARKSFESSAIQKSWQVHMQAFEPILKHAFVDNYKARIDLCAALNYISRNDLQKGLSKLEPLRAACICDNDRAAWLYFVGLCYERANMFQDMLYYYQEAGEFGHKFYLPYLKVAQKAHRENVYEVAKYQYEKAIACFDEMEKNENHKMILGSIYTNYASCLIMMHHIEEAEAALQLSKAISTNQKGRSATEAILMAVKGDKEKANEAIKLCAKETPNLYEGTKVMVDEILEKKHPQFYELEVTKNEIDKFWHWFGLYEEDLLLKLKAKDYDGMYVMIQEQLKELLPFITP